MIVWFTSLTPRKRSFSLNECKYREKKFIFWKTLQAHFVITVVIEKPTGTLGTQPHQYHLPRANTQVPAEAGDDICDSLYLARHSFQDTENHFWKGEEPWKTQKPADPNTTIILILFSKKWRDFYSTSIEVTCTCNERGCIKEIRFSLRGVNCQQRHPFFISLFSRVNTTLSYLWHYSDTLTLWVMIVIPLEV